MKSSIKEKFFDIIRAEMGVTLATSEDGHVTMRTVSPVYFDNKLLMFTSPNSNKYRQLVSNPNCCVDAKGMFAECEATLLGATMSDANAEYRRVYCDKFPGAFDEGVENGGREDVFVLLTPKRLTGWILPEGATAGASTIPFEETF